VAKLLQWLGRRGPKVMSRICVGYHFAKTGGTTLFAHYKKYRPSNAFNYGFYSNAIRFLGNKKQFEELPADALLDYHFLLILVNCQVNTITVHL